VFLVRLTSAAAEVMFRRRLFKRTAVFLAGSLLFPYVSQIYRRSTWTLCWFSLARYSSSRWPLL